MMRQAALTALSNAAAAFIEANQTVESSTEQQIPGANDIQITVTNGMIYIRSNGIVTFEPRALMQDSTKSLRIAMVGPSGKVCDCCNGSGRG